MGKRVFSVIIIAGFVVLVAVVGSHYSMMNRDWYDALSKPSWQPPNWVFPVVWNILFLLLIISGVMVWNKRPVTALTYYFLAAFGINGILNVFWSYLFFGSRLIFPAIYDALLLFLSVVLMMLLARPISRLASLLLLPYAIWTAFATFLTWTIHRLNG